MKTELAELERKERELLVIKEKADLQKQLTAKRRKVDQLKGVLSKLCVYQSLLGAA